MKFTDNNVSSLGTSKICAETALGEKGFATINQIVSQPNIVAGITNKPSFLQSIGAASEDDVLTNITSAQIEAALGYVPASDGVRTLDRFDRYPVGTIFGKGTTTNGGIKSPEIGTPWRISQSNKPFTVDAATDVFTSVGHQYTNGVPVHVLSNGALPAPLLGVFGNATTYYVRDATADTFKLAATLGGPAINITSTGSGSHSIGATGPIITPDGGLRFYPGELGYMGNDTTEPIKSLAIEMKIDGNPGGANSRNGFTLCFSKDPVLWENGNGIFVGGAIHLELDRDGIRINTIFQTSTNLGNPIGGTGVGPNGSSPFTFVEQLFGGSFPFGKKFVLAIEFEGDEMRITALGRTMRYKNPAIATAGYRHWFFEAEGFSLARGETPTFYRTWVNAPKLDGAPGWGGAQNSQILSELSSGGPVSLTQRNIILTGGQTDRTGYAQAHQETLHVQGTSFSGAQGGPIRGGGIVSDGRIKQGPPSRYMTGLGSVAVSYGRFVTEVVSVAGTNQNINLDAQLNNFPLWGLAHGDSQKVVLRASLGANANVKQLKLGDTFNIFELALPSTNQNGGTIVYEIEHLVRNLPNNWFNFEITTTTFDAAGLQTSCRFTRQSGVYGGPYFAPVWKTTGAAAGDLTFFYGSNVFYPCGDPS